MASSASSLHFLTLSPQTLHHPKPNSISTSLSLFSLPPSSLNHSLSSSSSSSSLTPVSIKRFESLFSSRFVRYVALSDFEQIEDDVDDGFDGAGDEEGLSDDGNSFGDEEASYSPDLKLFVGNLPYNVDSAALAGLFERAGNVEMVEVIYDKISGRSRGFGFVTMASKEEVEAAEQQFNGYELDGRALRVNSGPPPPKRESSSFRGGPGGRGGGSMDSSNRLYVGNLSWGVDQLALETLFSEQGRVVDARIVYDRDSGRSRGFGFVTYSSAEEVNSAIEHLDGVDLDGRPIRVSIAEARPPRRQF